MAKSRNNIVTAGLSGGIGNQLVFKQVNGETIVAKYPNRKGSSTPKQIALNNKFAKATVYAKNALQNAALKKVYADQAAKRLGVSAYAMAVALLLARANGCIPLPLSMQRLVAVRCS